MRTVTSGFFPIAARSRFYRPETLIELVNIVFVPIEKIEPSDFVGTIVCTITGSDAVIGHRI